MKRWYVVTPEYCEVIPITDEGQGPLECHSDVIEIEADTARDAVMFGVKEMLKGRCGKWGDRYRWCLEARLGRVSPYAGVKAIEIPEEEIENTNG